MTNPRSKCLLFLLPFLYSLIFFGCSKKKNLVYDFSYTGSPYRGKVIHFRNTSSGADKLSWSFGDGTTASEAKPDHTFSNGGIYNVSLMINDDSLHIIKKDIAIGFDSTTMTLLVSTRSYSHSVVGKDSTYPPANYTYPDTMITITEINPATISFGNEQLSFSSFSGNILKFENPDTDLSIKSDKASLSLDITTGQISYEHYKQVSSRYSFTDYKYSK